MVVMEVQSVVAAVSPKEATTWVTDEVVMEPCGPGDSTRLNSETRLPIIFDRNQTGCGSLHAIARKLDGVGLSDPVVTWKRPPFEDDFSTFVLGKG